MKYEGLKVGVVLLLFIFILINVDFWLKELPRFNILKEDYEVYEIKQDSNKYYVNDFYIHYSGNYVIAYDSCGRKYYVAGNFTIKKIK